MFPRALALGTAVAAVLASSAASATTEPPTTAPATDTFTVQHAENFTLTYDGDHKVLTVGPAGTAATFVLVQRGTEPPALDGELAGATVIEVPIETMFSESSSHYGFIDVLDIEGTVDRRRRRLAGRHAELPSAAARRRDRVVRADSSIDTELVVAADPDVYVTGGSDDPAHEVIAPPGSPSCQRRVAGDDARRDGRSGSACSPPSPTPRRRPTTCTPNGSPTTTRPPRWPPASPSVRR